MAATHLSPEPTAAAPRPPLVAGAPVIGNTLDMARDPAAFFLRCYREYGPAFRIRVLGREQTVIAGPEAAVFMGTKDGRDSLRSKEFWAGLTQEYGAQRTLTGEDGQSHKELRAIMRRGYSRQAMVGRYEQVLGITEQALDRDWAPGTTVPVVPAMQYLVVDQLGTLLTGEAPREYVEDIRLLITYILNVLVTKQRPKVLLADPRYKRAKARVNELGEQMIARYRAEGPRAGEATAGANSGGGAAVNGDSGGTAGGGRGTAGGGRGTAGGGAGGGGTAGRTGDSTSTSTSTSTSQVNLIEDIMRANAERPDLMPDSDLVLALTGPYVAGLDTVANTLAATVYAVLKHPDVHDRVVAEADALFTAGPIDEAALTSATAINGAISEAMRLYPIAVAQMRTATRDFTFEGMQIEADEMLYVATSVPHFMGEFFPDPERFDIDRYAKPRAEHNAPGAYSPYGRGPHLCLGKTLAEVQMAMSIATLFHERSLSLVPADYTLKTKTAPTPGPSRRFSVAVTAR